MAYKSGNPALNKNTFSKLGAATVGEAMTLDGVVRKSLFLFVLCVGSGIYGWTTMGSGNTDLALLFPVAAIGAFIVGLITIFKRNISPFTVPIYAVLEGYVLGAVSNLYEAEFGGIVLQALLLTASIFLSMLFLYMFRVIKVTENFKLGVASATIGIALYYVANLVTSMFGFNLPLIYDNSWWGIGFSVLVVAMAALNLVVDFDFIEAGVSKKAPKFMEWYSSFGLFVTVVWLYLEILRLLAKFRSR